MGMNYQKKAIEIMDNVSKVIVGKEDVTKLVLTSLIAGGHVLLEDVPGTGKTMLAKTVAKSVDAQFSRIQFTPDLLPSDVTGINYTIRRPVNLSSAEDLYFPIFCWQMRLTVQRRVHSRHCLNVWRNIR